MSEQKDKMIRLPPVEEIKDWLGKELSHLNPDVRDYLFLGVEALYVHLGGERFINIKMPGDKD